ncbi:MAG: HNH endonuclease [Gemmatimonadetes bacterium]|nr:HNH endonuclease [Gemmatimonadota bacterium]
MKRRLSKIAQEGGQADLERVVAITAQNLSVVSISLRDPLVAPKIFERLNNRAELVTVADLVRNEVFAKVSQDAAEAQHVFANQWEPFVQRFAEVENGLEKFLFPYGLLLDRGITKAELFTRVRSHWNTLGPPAVIIADMSKYVGTFLSVESGRADPTLPAAIQQRLDRLHRIGRPSSIFSFVMRLVDAFKSAVVPEEAVLPILDLIESFLFRRALLGIEPTGLHAVFKGLWHELTGIENPPGVSADAVKAAIVGKPTVAWPTDAEFRAGVLTGELYRRKVVQYALREYEVACEGESPQDEFQIEHILPQTATTAWQEAFGDRYEGLINTWANLVPLTGRMNAAAGQALFANKREEYANSIFASTREIAEEYQAWTPIEVDERAAALAAWAMTRWPYGR